MRKQIINFREERELGQNINATFSFIRQNFKLLCKCILFFAAPFALLSGIFNGLYQSRLYQVLGDDRPYSTYGEYTFFNQVTSLNYLVSIFFSVVSFVMMGLAVYCYMLEYMDNEGEATTEGVWARFKANAIPLLYATIGAVIITTIGLLLLVIPGIYAAVTLSVFMMVLLREEIGFIEGLERCLYLIKGNWWSTFFLLFVIGLIQGIINVVPAIPAFILPFLGALELPGSTNTLISIILVSISSVLGIFIYSISIIAAAFQYFHLVEVRDGIGLMEQVALIGQSTTRFEANEGDY
ncbi:hypothetical protein [Pontibacter sp. SGAir0037]|uniref:hypothetical protein n=1 Tax=Pontibacter sp. SGAir0037 TaxID=2571030 RepID=UPI0010CCB2AF|nr:hypothetical protein [Pontibacter sp. SGAir0037]QCR22686.1 hypothetical protein C1N53_10250 [Pontibacter sp. SGAir0037]